MEMGDTGKAKEVFQKLSEIEAIFEEENKHIFNEFGIELRKANMIDEAFANYQKAITISPQDEHLYFNVARIHYDKKEWDNALKWLQKALEINPHFRDAQIFEALIIKEMKEQGITPAASKEESGKAAMSAKSPDGGEGEPDAGTEEKPPVEVKKSAPPQRQTVKQ